MSLRDWFRRPKPRDRASARTELAGYATGLTVLRDRDANGSPSILTLRPGDRLANTYRIERLLGEGGMGSVYLAHHERWDIDLVVKVPNQQTLSDPEHRHRIAKEAEAWTNLGLHPHVAYCFYLHPLDGVPLLIIEYVEGGDLRPWIANGKCADLRFGLNIAIQICHGVQRAHSLGMIHRDIKPENVLVGRDGVAKVTDFGIVGTRAASLAADFLATIGANGAQGPRTVSAIGTWDYMPPEQFEPDQMNVGAQSDIFSFGVCLYEMFCGWRPYAIASGPRQEAPEPRASTPEGVIPERLCRLMKRCVEWDWERRPRDLSEVRKELSGVYTDLFQQSSPFAEVPEVSLDAEAWNNRGVSYSELGNEEQALQCFIQALAAKPFLLAANYNHLLLQWRRGEIRKFSDLIAPLSKLRGLPGIDPRELALALAELHYAFGDSDAAKAELAPYPGLKRTTHAAKPARRTSRHLDDVLSTALTPDGRFVLTGSRDKTLRLWDLSTDKCWPVLDGEDVNCVALSSDGRRGFSVSGYLRLKLWDLTSRQCIRTFHGHSGPVYSVAMTADGRLGLSAGQDGILRLWNMETGDRLQVFKGHTHSVESVALVPDGRFALSGSEDQTVRLWETAVAKPVLTLEGHTSSVKSVAIGLDGRRGLSGSRDGTLKFWNLENGKLLRTLEGHRNIVTSVGLSADCEYALSGSYDNTLKLWDLQNGRCLRTIAGHEDRVTTVCLSADGRCFVSGSADKTIRVWDGDGLWRSVQRFKLCRPKTLNELSAEQKTRQTAISQVEISYSRSHPLQAYEELMLLWKSLGFNRDVRLEAIYSKLLAVGRFGQEFQLARYFSHEEFTKVLSISEDGRSALSKGRDNAFRLWDLETGVCLHTLEGHSGSVRTATIAPNRHQAVSGGGDNMLKVWDLTSGQCLRTLEGHTNWVQTVTIVANGRKAISGSADKTLKMWDLETGECLLTLEGHKDCVSAVAAIPASHRALSGSWDRTLRLWDLETGDCLRVLIGHSDRVYCIAVTADGRSALSAGKDNLVRLWNLDTGRCVREFEGHAKSIQAVAVTPDGRRGLSGSWDDSLKLWDLESAGCLQTMEIPAADTFAITPDASWILTGHDDRSVTYWRVIWDLEFMNARNASSD